MLRLETILTTLTLTVSLTACSHQEEDFGSPPEQLEAISIEGSVPDANSQGVLTVTGSEHDFVLTLAHDDFSRTIQVHSPAKSDLSALDGKTVTLAIEGDDGSSEPNLLIRDDAGVLYYADAGSWMEGATDAGVPFVNRGEPVARVTDPHHDYDAIWEYTPVVFHTDEGEVSVLPGEVKSIRHGGKTFRAAAIAAYDVTLTDETTCAPSPLLSYELLRVDAPPPALKLVRPTHLRAATRACGP